MMIYTSLPLTQKLATPTCNVVTQDGVNYIFIPFYRELRKVFLDVQSLKARYVTLCYNPDKGYYLSSL